MARLDLVADLKGSLHDAANVFTASGDADFDRLLDAAAKDFSRVRPRTLLGEITLTALLDTYAAPADLLAYKSDIWVDAHKAPKPWEANWPGPMPRVRAVEVAGEWQLVFEPAPTALMIGLYGSSFRFYYLAAHSIGDTAAATTIRAGDRGLLLLRAQAEACREMAMRNLGKPVQMRDGFSGQPRNGTPAALFETLMAEFERRADR